MDGIFSVNDNTLKPEPVLQKKNDVVCYHTVNESTATVKSLTTHIDNDNNPIDLLTMVSCGVERKYK